ncbi:hypothetical protein BGZ73_007939 [Actinomortierella ambigua]|nr:hypothetical protein BGZ73_007939 [Actinomortierella ambigua]
MPEATSGWRTLILAKVMGTQLYESNNATCDMLSKGCPTTFGPATLNANFSVEQSAPFVELMITLEVRDKNNATIACAGVLIEQTMPKANTVVSYIPLGLAGYAGFISLVSIIMRASVGNGILGAVATYGLPAEMMSVHTPGLFDIIFYTQFMLMTGQLAINYPSFYQSFTSLFHWSFLEFSESLAGEGPSNATEVLIYQGAGSVNVDSKSLLKPGSKANTNRKRNLPDWFLNLNIDNNNLQPELWVTSRLPPTPTPTPTSTPTTTPRITQRPQLARRQEAQSTDASSGATVLPSPSPSPSPSPEPEPSSSTSTKSKTSSSKKPPKPSNSDGPAVPLTSSSTVPVPRPTLGVRDAFANNGESQAYNVSLFGMSSYAAAFKADPKTLFLCTFINTLLSAAGALVASAFFLVLAWMMARARHQRGKTLQHALNFVAGNLIRVWALVYTPLALSAMYQLTLSGGTLMIAVASMSLLVITVGATIFFTWRILRASSEMLLFEDQATLLKYGPLYNTLADEGILFLLVGLLVRFLWGLAVSMLSSYGVAQVVILMVVELGYMVVIGIKWPFAESVDNKFHLFLGIVRVIITGCSIAYLETLGATPEMRQLFGYIQMALHLSVFVVMFAVILWNTIQIFMFWSYRHASAWKGPRKSYVFEENLEAEPGWVMAGRAIPVQDCTMGPDGLLVKPRRYTADPYSMQEIREHNMRHSMPVHSSLGDDYQHLSPAEYYRRSRLAAIDRRSRQMGAVVEDDQQSSTIDQLSETHVPLARAAGAISARSVSPRRDSPGASLVSLDDPLALAIEGEALTPTLRQSAHVDSYARQQRMSHQQSAIEPRRTQRRMSELLRDGDYRYKPQEQQESSTTAVESEAKPGRFAAALGAIGGVFRFGRRKSPGAGGDGPKPKAFEVIRPPRRTFVEDDEDNVRELSSFGISRFFQESDRGYERNRNLFVANPEAMLSHSGSVHSSMSGVPARLHRRVSEAAGSTMTLPNSVTHNDNASVTQSSLAHTRLALGSEHGGDASSSDYGTSASRRVSALGNQVFARSSVESNIAEALKNDVPLRLEGGGILKVSKGPEKSVQYWHKESGQYVESVAEPQRPPTLVIPSPRSPVRGSTQIETSSIRQPSIASRSPSRPESPSGSHHSGLAVSAERMHEILERMFSSDHDGQEDSDSISEDACSTFSEKVSATILSLQQKQDANGSSTHLDVPSVPPVPSRRPDILEPVLETGDALEEDESSLIMSRRRATSRSLTQLDRSLSPPNRSPSVSSSIRSGYHASPYVPQQGGGTAEDHPEPSYLNRNPSVATTMTARTDISYRTALSNPSDDDLARETKPE